MQSPSGDEEKLMENVYMLPVLVGVDASHASFQMYRGGVYSDPACSKEKLDHAMQLIGYGTTMGGQDYWICKNSWGESYHLLQQKTTIHCPQMVLRQREESLYKSRKC